jgi:hypothetical protein
MRSLSDLEDTASSASMETTQLYALLGSERPK